MAIDTDKAFQQYQRFIHLRDNGHQEFLNKADKCDNFLAGNQWLESDLATLREQMRPAMTINKILPTVSTLLGEQILNRTEVLFRPSAGAPSETADALSKVWMQVSQNNQLPWIRSDVFCDGLVRSRGFYDVRMAFDDSMFGEVQITLQNSKNTLIDCDAEEYDPDKWGDVVTTKWMTPQDIEILYNGDDAEYLRSKNGSEFMYGYDSIERTRDRFGGPLAKFASFSGSEMVLHRNIRTIDRQHRVLNKQEHFVDVMTGDMRPVPENWDRNRIAAFLEKMQGRLGTYKKMVKRIRWTVTADNVVLHDEWSPYKHFTIVPYFPYFRYGQTLGVVENLLGPQEILNKASSQELHVINTTANSGYTVEENSLANMTVEELEQSGAKTGIVIVHRKGSLPPAKIQPNQIPTGLDRITFKAEEAIKSISNVSDSMQGFDREDVAAKAIAYKGQRGSVNMAKALDNLQRTDWILARNTLDLVQNFYSEQRIINITHDDVTRESETIEVNVQTPEGTITNDLTIGEFDIVITSVPFRDSLEDSQFEQGMAMREAGIQIPDSVLIENSRLMRRSQIVKDMEAAANSPEAKEAAALQKRGAEAEVSLKEAQAQKTMADTAKSGADAQIKQNEAAGGNDGELQKMQAELQMQREKLDMELEKMRQEMQIEREKIQMEFAQKQQEHSLDMQIKEQTAAQDAQLKQQQAEQAAAQQRAQALKEQSEPAGDKD